MKESRRITWRRPFAELTETEKEAVLWAFVTRWLRFTRSGEEDGLMPVGQRSEASRITIRAAYICGWEGTSLWDR